MAPSLNAAQYSESPELCASGHRKKKGGAIEECQPAARGIPSEMCLCHVQKNLQFRVGWIGRFTSEHRST